MIIVFDGRLGILHPNIDTSCDDKIYVEMEVDCCTFVCPWASYSPAPDPLRNLNPFGQVCYRGGLVS